MANPKKVTSPQYETLAESVQNEFADIESGSLFGMPCLKVRGKAVIGSFDGGAVFKLEGDAHGEALALAGSVLFDPSGKGRPMKAWVVVNSDHEEKWVDFASEAISATNS
jgi:hypothetical protein